MVDNLIINCKISSSERHHNYPQNTIAAFQWIFIERKHMLSISPTFMSLQQMSNTRPEIHVAIWEDAVDFYLWPQISPVSVATAPSDEPRLNSHEQIASAPTKNRNKDMFTKECSPFYKITINCILFSRNWQQTEPICRQYSRCCQQSIAWRQSHVALRLAWQLLSHVPQFPPVSWEENHLLVANCYPVIWKYKERQGQRYINCLTINTLTFVYRYIYIYLYPSI